MTQVLATAIALLASLTLCFRKESKHSDRFPILVDGKYGYLNKAGNVVIKPQFDSAASFSDGLALVKIEGSYRYISTAGDPAFDRKYEDARSFAEGLGTVFLRDSAGPGWGVIDRAGKVVFKARFGWPVQFSEGLAWLGPTFLDRKGDTVVSPLLPSQSGRFSEGLAWVSVGELYGYINKAGKVVTEPQFDWVSDFHDGLAFFMNEGTPPDRWGYINKAGKVVIRPQFEKAGDFSEGLAPVRIDGKWGYIDRAGRVVIAPQFAEERGFSEGLAAVGFGGGPLRRLDLDGGEWNGPGEGSGYGYIDKTGKMVIKPQFSRAGDFSDGLAQVWVGGGVGRSERAERQSIDRSHKSRYIDTYRFGYIDKTGKYIW
ncbi:MAG: WG repeat-containing protein [candidate division WOR-3 bacterium]|nr:WG repeat-containing protein [candidate division WOR-3 bacterium]